MFHEADMTPAVVARRDVKRRGQHTQTFIQQQYQLEDAAAFIIRGPDGSASEASGVQRNPFHRVALQFPDSLLGDVVLVVRGLTEILTERGLSVSNTTSSSSSSCCTEKKDSEPSADVRLLVLADNTFGACCPDEITAQHYDCDCIVHFGEACMSRSARLPVYYCHEAFTLFPLKATEPLAKNNAALSHTAQLISASIVCEAVAQLTKALAEKAASMEGRQPSSDDDNSNEDGNNGCGLGDVRPRLVVLGTYESKAIVELAQELYVKQHSESESIVPVDFCTFSAATAPQPVEASSPPADASPSGTQTSGNAAEHLDVDMDMSRYATPDSWVVNGVVFPRLPAPGEVAEKASGRSDAGGSGGTSSSSEKKVITAQHFLFVGPTDAPQLLHLFNVAQYNAFHGRTAAKWIEETSTVPFRVDAVTVFTDKTLPTALLTDGVHEKSQFAGWSKMFVSKFLGFPLEACDATDSSLPSCEEAAASAREDSDKALAQAQRTLLQRQRARAFNMEVIRHANSVGVLVASLAIHGYKEMVQQLHKLLRLKGKRSYVIYVGHLNNFKLANFVDSVDCFVAVACPNSRSSYFPTKADGYVHPVVSPSEAILAFIPESNDDNASGKQAQYLQNQNATSAAEMTSETSSEAKREHLMRMAQQLLFGHPMLYSTDFRFTLPALRCAVLSAECAKEMAAKALNGQVVTTETAATVYHHSEDAGGMSLIGRVGDGTLVANGATASSQSIARLHQRTYIGLEPQVGETPVQTQMEEGRHGIARGYTTEREAQEKSS